MFHGKVYIIPKSSFVIIALIEPHKEVFCSNVIFQLLRCRILPCIALSDGHFAQEAHFISNVIILVHESKQFGGKFLEEENRLMLFTAEGL